jgi:hypothetical protein
MPWGKKGDWGYPVPIGTCQCRCTEYIECQLFASMVVWLCKKWRVKYYFHFIYKYLSFLSFFHKVTLFDYLSSWVSA